MGFLAHVYIGSTCEQVTSVCEAKGLVVCQGPPETFGETEWLRIDPEWNEDLACELSTEIDFPVVYFKAKSAPDAFEVSCFVGGECVRQLRWSARPVEGWTETHGPSMPFEHPALREWLEREALAITDSYDVLACFLGADQAPQR